MRQRLDQRVGARARLPEMRLSLNHLSSIRPGVVLETGVRVDAPVEELALIHSGAIPRRMEGTAADVDAALHSEVALP